MTHFSSQYYPDIKAKLRHLEKGSLTLQAEVLELAFKVYHARNDKAHNHNCQMLASHCPSTDQGDRPLSPTNPCCPHCSLAHQGLRTARPMFQMW